MTSYEWNSDPALWSIFDCLKGTSEEQRRRVLRPQFQMSVPSPDRAALIATRRSLDVAFRELTRLEIHAQIGLEVPDTGALKTQLKSALAVLLDSDAVLRYTNANLFFGVRFLAGRLSPLSWPCQSASDGQLRAAKNRRPFILLQPPSVNWEEKSRTSVQLFEELKPYDDPDDALPFLDGAVLPQPPAGRRATALEEPKRFEMWLRGLSPDIGGPEGERFRRLRSGIVAWATRRTEFYLNLPSTVPSDTDRENSLRPAGGWVVDSPFAARFGLADFYWIAKILRADVNANCAVSYESPSWLHLFRIRASLDHNDPKAAEDLMKVEEVLRSVMGLTAGLVRNATEVTDEAERRACEPEAAGSTSPQAHWRQTFDDELHCIAKQREIRRYGALEHRPAEQRRSLDPPPGTGSSPEDWSEKVKSGYAPHHLIGLALSGGGIRSATFGLGVLQGLQELDYLRSIDYLSTVSGGGFIGAWLVANVFRSQYWLSRLTSWDESIAHLRKYSSYLSPITGILSSDSWTMWAIYARNTLLIQITGLACLVSVLLLAFETRFLFFRAGSVRDILWTIAWPGMIAIAMYISVIGVLLLTFIDAQGHGSRNLLKPRWYQKGWGAGTVRWLAVFPSWVAAFFMAALIWGDATGRTFRGPVFAELSTYSDLLQHAFIPWAAILVSVLVGLSLTCYAAVRLHPVQKVFTAIGFGFLCTVAFYLQLCGIMRIFFAWRVEPEQYNWYAFVLGPSLMLATCALTVVLFIGLTGRYCDDAVREWWTRFGALLMVVAVVYLAITAAAVFGPLLVLGFFHNAHPALSWSAVGTAVTTIGGGLFAGRSGKTDGQAAQPKARALEVLARIGGFTFIVTTILAASTLLFLVLQLAATNDSVLACSGPLSSCYWTTLNAIPQFHVLFALLVSGICAATFSYFFDINLFGLSQFYTNRLVRCYLGASRWASGARKPQAFTGFDSDDDLNLSDLNQKDFRGPFPIVNCSLNLGGSSDLSLHTRHSASFSLTPLRCGSDRRKIGFAPTGTARTAGAQTVDDSFAEQIKLGQAIAVSGAAINPNMGYNTSPLVAFLLTMFNLRLGWWFPNPGQRRWRRGKLSSSFYYLFRELIGTADENRNFVNVSDGGHFENLGIYELVRRRCRLIIAADAECDEFYTFGSLGNLLRICETDFGAKIDIDISSIRPGENGFGKAHAAVGKIVYDNGAVGYLLYLKSSVTGDEEVGIAQYRSTHPSFPHESTANQFFAEDQFESYRRLGRHAVRQSFREVRTGEDPVDAVGNLSDLLSPQSAVTGAFLTHTKALDRIWERFRNSPGLTLLLSEIAQNGYRWPGRLVTNEEFCAVNELLQFMENVFLDLRLDEFWTHPDNRGWAMLFTGWARTRALRQVWKQTRSTYGIRFEYFCATRLGLERDEPVVRV